MGLERYVGMKNTISIIFGGWNTHFEKSVFLEKIVVGTEKLLFSGVEIHILKKCVSWKIVVGMKKIFISSIQSVADGIVIELCFDNIAQLRL